MPLLVIFVGEELPGATGVVVVAVEGGVLLLDGSVVVASVVVVVVVLCADVLVSAERYVAL